ncbi:methionyl-tRNA formyltransferase [Mycoplasmopsis caviae]|uniref:Methionyl-tRNA formyltransferase n=1 Tax=Mycoplasmopsis caviae TaxID=55603 RepID=A0A3P8LBC8_9BACT|nr:methionyl-tRNA formyltransferase [Mycoplasmopsis caviae]UUD34781.1 methionyl-tRNA formyltransferase [Mycoplasmopsis caviae]VDR42361.1 Methionyl-tRNA formyltransferase [Mycoplasmopsis caviae]
MKLLLAGTPAFAVEIFEKLINNFEVVAIVSQPDRPSVRGHKLTPTPTKQLAQKYNIKCFQPEKISQIKDELEALNYDYLITCAFGQYIPENVLKIAKKLNLNIHGSLLPKYRGAAPIQYSLLNNDQETGISLMEMVKQMDAGDIFVQKAIKIEEYDTTSILFNKLSKLTCDNIVQWLIDLDLGKLKRIKQDESKVTLSPKLDKEKALLSSELCMQEAINIIRAYELNPGAYTFIDNKRVKIFFATKKEVKNAPKLKFSDGYLYATDYQFESKKRIKLI